MTQLAGPDDLNEFVIEAPAETSEDCDGAVTVSDRGNVEHAWWYLTNGADRDATVTIRRTWEYQGETRSDTRQHTLYPGEEREVFSFPRRQNPRIALIRCRIG